MTLTGRGMALLNRLLATAMSNENGITCTPNDGGSAITLTDWIGTPGRVAVDVATGDFQSRNEHDLRDYIGPLASLKRGSTQLLPTEGMRFVEVIGGTSYTYEALPGDGVASWDWCDAEKTRIRVHCKRQVV